MSQKKNKEKERSWNSFAYLASLAKKKEPVILYLNSNTIEEESTLRGIIMGVDNYTIAFLADTGRELLVFKHSIRFIEKVS